MSSASEKAISRLLNQFSDSDRIRKLLEAFIERFDDSTDILNDLKSNRDLATANGYWLNVLGDIVGISRPSEHLNDDYIFTYRSALEQLLRDLDCLTTGTVYNPVDGIVLPFGNYEKRLEGLETIVRNYPSFSNYLSYSNEFNGRWTKAIATDQLIDNYILGPDGIDLSASTFILDSSNSYHRFYLTPNTPSDYFFIALKQGNKRWSALQHTGLANSVAWFDLELGVTGQKQANVESHSIQEIGGGWFLCMVCFSSVPSGGNFSVYAANSNGGIQTSGDGSTPSLYMFGALGYVSVRTQLPLIKTSGSSVATQASTYEATNHGNLFGVPLKITPLDYVYTGVSYSKPIMSLTDESRKSITFAFIFDEDDGNYYWQLSGSGFEAINIMCQDTDADMVPDNFHQNIESTFTFEKIANNSIKVIVKSTVDETEFEEEILFEDPLIQFPIGDYQWYVGCNGLLTGQWNCLIELGEEYDLGDSNKAYSALGDLDGGHYNGLEGIKTGIAEDDETYRFFINAKALATLKKSTVQDIYTFISDTFDISARITTGDTGEIIVEIDEFLTNQQRFLLQKYAPKAGGTILWIINWPESE